MPSHDQNLAAVRAACVAANPSLMCARCPHCGEECGRAAVGELCLQCANGTLYDAVATPTLPDVLLALGLDKKFYPSVSDGFKDASVLIRLLGLWNLRLPLSGQSEETVAYLANLLKPNE